MAARRLQLAREEMAALGETHSMPVENLLTPDLLRRVLWSPPRVREPGDLVDAVVDQLAAMSARRWQIALTTPLITRAILTADREAAEAADAAEIARAAAAAAVLDQGDDDADGESDGDPEGASDGESEGDSGT